MSTGAETDDSLAEFMSKQPTSARGEAPLSARSGNSQFNHLNFLNEHPVPLTRAAPEVPPNAFGQFGPTGKDLPADLVDQALQLLNAVSDDHRRRERKKEKKRAPPPAPDWQDPGVLSPESRRKRDKQQKHDPWGSSLEEKPEKSPKTEKVKKAFDLEAELGRIVGLGKVKDALRSLNTMVRAHQKRVERGLTTKNSQRTMCHMLMIGNSGTGKTTTARLVARMLKQIGLLKKGHLVEVSAKDLIAGHCGQTATKTASVCDKARGGVLFIDEAYSINPKGESTFGQECVDTLVKEMEDHYHEMVVVMAGYPAPMNAFLSCNDGLSSRFDDRFRLEFEAYNEEELGEILVKEIHSRDYTLAIGLEETLPHIISTVTTKEQREQGNGRLMRSLACATIARQNERWVDDESPSDEVMITIQREDFFHRRGNTRQELAEQPPPTPSSEEDEYSDDQDHVPDDQQTDGD